MSRPGGASGPSTLSPGDAGPGSLALALEQPQPGLSFKFKLISVANVCSSQHRDGAVLPGPPRRWPAAASASPSRVGLVTRDSVDSVAGAESYSDSSPGPGREALSHATVPVRGQPLA